MHSSQLAMLASWSGSPGAGNRDPRGPDALG
jgi:hypothetical protein